MIRLRGRNKIKQKKGIVMLYQIMDGTVSAGGVPILSHIDFEIKGTEKIAVAGKNGAGKTTLLRLLAGEISLDRDDKRNGPGIMASRRLTVGMMRQQPFGDTSCTVEEELLKGCPGREVAGKNGTGLSSSAIFRNGTGNGSTMSGSMISCLPVSDSQKRIKKEAVGIFRRRADEDCTDPAFAGKTGYSAAR